MYIAQARDGRFRIVKNLGSIDPDEHMVTGGLESSGAG